MLTQFEKLNETILERVKLLKKKKFKEVIIDKSKLEELGKGNFGTVYKYEDAEGNERVIKFVKIPEKIKDKEQEKYIEEKII